MERRNGVDCIFGLVRKAALHVLFRKGMDEFIALVPSILSGVIVSLVTLWLSGRQRVSQERWTETGRQKAPYLYTPVLTYECSIVMLLAEHGTGGGFETHLPYFGRDI